MTGKYNFFGPLNSSSGAKNRGKLFAVFGRPRMEHTITDAYPVRVLGIDELSIKKRHKQFVLVLSDIDRKCGSTRINVKNY